MENKMDNSCDKCGGALQKDGTQLVCSKCGNEKPIL
jgi:DNA-directed RNA polymerase subunit M/transcription elongation factor TFIIS